MKVGMKRTFIARASATVGALCGVIGFATALTDHTARLPPWGWMLAGILVSVLALFVLVDGAIAYERFRVAPRSIDD